MGPRAKGAGVGVGVDGLIKRRFEGVESFSI